MMKLRSMQYLNKVILVLSFLLLSQFDKSICHKHSQKPLMLLVSFDGFRWDYLKMHNLTNFNYLKNAGSHAEYIYNSFSTVTFPNHWTIVTGLFEETHGIMQNYMYDPILKKNFSYTSSDSQNINWYGQNKITEPIWTTNQKAGDGRRSAAEWVGAQVTFNDQVIIHIPYNYSKPYKQLIDEFIKLYTAEEDPINFGAIYFDEPDHTGHLYGPYSKQMKEKLVFCDETLGYLIDQLKSHHLFDKLNLIVTSDHGMSPISNETAIFLDTHIDTDLFYAYGTRAVYSLFVKKVSDLEYVYKTLKKVDHIDVFKKDEIPPALNYKNNMRIGDIVIVTHINYTVYINSQKVNWSLNNGDHGYYNNETTMYPIFIAHGPGFKKNFTINPFRNVDIYPLMCLLLGVQPAINNGSIANVLDMVIYNRIDTNFSLVFLLLSLIPITLLAATSVFVCFVARKSSPSNINKNNTNGYTTIATSEINNIDDDLDDDSIIPIIGSN